YARTNREGRVATLQKARGVSARIAPCPRPPYLTVQPNLPHYGLRDQPYSPIHGWRVVSADSLQNPALEPIRDRLAAHYLPTMGASSARPLELHHARTKDSRAAGRC